MRIAGFEFAEGARFQSGEHPDAKIVGEHIELLRARFKGELTPEDVLDDAKNPNSPLHSFFEWSDTEAARQYRLQQARGLIRAVVAIYVKDDAPAVKARAYVNIKKSGEPQHYRELTHAMSQKDTRDVVLRRAWSEFQQWRKRYSDLEEFATFFDAADQFEMKLLGNAKH